MENFIVVMKVVVSVAELVVVVHLTLSTNDRFRFCGLNCSNLVHALSALEAL